jgi:hypothetical protein
MLKATSGGQGPDAEFWIIVGATPRSKKLTIRLEKIWILGTSKQRHEMA